MAGWLSGDGRPRQWSGQSLSLPPPRLIAVFVIVILLLSHSWFNNYKAQMERTEFGFRFLFFLLPVFLIFVVRWMFVDWKFSFGLPQPRQEAIHRAGSSPWRVAAAVLVLLFMVSYQSSFHSQWFRPLWRRRSY